MRILDVDRLIFIVGLVVWIVSVGFGFCSPASDSLSSTSTTRDNLFRDANGSMALTNESGTFDLDGELTVNRLGFGAMRLCGEGIIGPPEDEQSAKEVAQHAVELGVDFIDTADSYGPGVSERLLGEAIDTDT